MDYGNINLEYKIPNEIKSCIKREFYVALLGELVSINGSYILLSEQEKNKNLKEFYEKNPEKYAEELSELVDLDIEDSKEPIYDFHSGTFGWSAAFKMTCKKLDMMWLWDYYHNLPSWIESDLFDGEIEEEVGKVVIAFNNDEDIKDYYSWIINHLFREGEQNDGTISS